MKRYIILIIAAALAFFAPSCQKSWEMEQDLNVYSTRINLNNVYECSFTVTVFSNQDWSASVSGGSSWLTLQENGGSGLDYLHVYADSNMDPQARVGKIALQNASGKKLTINIVQSGSDEAAADVPDELL
ncbi:MAG: BACON domain-containing protein [Bacteroidales bacterium]|nr:BACON domain-containing protein [Bacteroidales bacterium]